MTQQYHVIKFYIITSAMLHDKASSL